MTTATRSAADPPVAVEPVRIGPTWQRDGAGGWLRPQQTLGWSVLYWAAENLQHDDGSPWRYTPEQARFVLWWYALDPATRAFAYTSGVFQRIKGHGKDPLAATLAAVEFVGPCRVDGSGRTVADPWGNQHPAAVPNPSAWVQIAAVSKDQTRNTMRLFPALFTRAAIERYQIDLGKEIIYARHGQTLIEAVTSSPRALEGARASLCVKNETHHWLATNEGHEMAATIDRNAEKAPGGEGRALSITNAYEPSENSVAQREREEFEAMTAGTTLASGVLYDSLEAPPEAPLTAEAAPAVIEAVRGDSVWLSVPRIVNAILSPRNPPSRSRRYWYNQIVAAEDAWLTPQDFDLCVAPDEVPDLTPGDEIALFFDGSKSDDATGLVGCRITDGYVATLGMWQRPPGARGDEWTAPRAVIDDQVDHVMATYAVAGFFADPSHTLDDETRERYWDALIDDWHRRYADGLKVWATPGKIGHSVMWDMTSHVRQESFVAAAERCVTDVQDTASAVREDPAAPRLLIHDGDGRLRAHARNARRYPTRHGVSLWKGHRESSRKVDLAVCMVGARMVRRLVLNLPEHKRRRRSGKVW